MPNVIQSIFIGCVVQIMAIIGLTAFMYVHTDNVALKYAQMAEDNANAHTAVLVQSYYNRTLLERSQERRDIEGWVDKRIDLRISQDHLQQTQH